MKLTNFKINDKALYWGLIITFSILYFFVGLVSTIHAFAFFQLANSATLALLLSIGFELGQSSVLFSLLMTKNKDKFLPWLLMFGLTAVQITGNVFASFKHLSTSGSNDWIFWQKTILFGVQAPNAEMYQVIIAYLQGAILPLVALGMVALVVQNVKHFSEEIENKKEEIKEDDKFVSADLTNVEPIELIRDKKDDEFVKLYDDIDESGIGGELSKEEEKQISDFIAKEKLDDLDQKVVNLTPELEKQKQDLEEEIVAKVSELAKEKARKKEPTLNREKSKKHKKDIIPEILKKKRGRPPKEKEKVAVPKKEQGLLQKEENVSVPLKERKSRTLDPLKKKSTTQPIKNLEEIIKPFKGEEVIKLIESTKEQKDVVAISKPNKDEQVSQESLLVPPELKTPYLDGGVEVIDAKAVTKLPENVKKN